MPSSSVSGPDNWSAEATSLIVTRAPARTKKRAKAVRNYLVELGVGANRLAVVSYGKERPFCNERSESCYQQNRRGHVVVRSK